MQLILAVYDALRSFDRECTRAEIEREACLCRDEVRVGLDGLRRRGILRMIGLPRQQATYRLTSGAPRPEETARGRYERSEELRARLSLARQHHRVARPPQSIPGNGFGPGHRYSPASGPSYQASPGVARIVKSGMSLGGTKLAISPFTLADVWRKR